MTTFLQLGVPSGDSAEERAVHERYMMLASSGDRKHLINMETVNYFLRKLFLVLARANVHEIRVCKDSMSQDGLGSKLK